MPWRSRTGHASSTSGGRRERLKFPGHGRRDRPVRVRHRQHRLGHRMSFNMDDYVDVAERIRQFNENSPDGSLQSHLEPVKDSVDNLIGWLCKAYAYRTADDPTPGVGHAFEPIPGKTPYKREREAMKAE